MIKDIVYEAISAAGHQLTPYSYFHNLDLSHHLRELFAHLKISCVLDVGANEGQFRNFLRRRCGYKGLIVSFEPVRSVFEIIQAKSKGDPKWLVNHYALGAQTGKMSINVMQDPHFNSFLQPQMPEIDHPEIEARNVVARQEEVDVRTLSEVMKELGRQQELGNVYLKMDTQGFDFEVLRGAGAALQGISALQTEVPVKPLYQGMVTFSTAISELKAYGFDVTGLFSVERDRLLRVVEFDCVAVKISSGENLLPSTASVP